MAQLVPVEFDPFAQASGQPTLVPVDHDPFAPAPSMAAEGSANLPRGIVGTIKDEAGNALQAGGDIVRLIGKGAAMGKEATPEDWADRSASLANLGSRMSGGRMQAAPQPSVADYMKLRDQERADLHDAEQRAGWAGTAAELLGSFAPASTLQKGVTAGAAAARSVPVLGKVFSSPIVQAAAGGAGYGALDAAGTDRSMTDNAALGSLAGVGGHIIGSALAGGISKVAGKLAPTATPKIMSQEEINAAKNAAYKAADAEGVVYTPQLFQRAKDEIIPTLTDMGYTPKLQPRIATVLDELEKAAHAPPAPIVPKSYATSGTELATSDGPISPEISSFWKKYASTEKPALPETNFTTLKGADTIRKIASNAFEPGNNANNAMVRKIVAALDDAIASPKTGDFIAGDAKKAGDLLVNARQMAAREFKGEKIAQALKDAEFKASRTGTGGNIDNAIRQEIDKIRRNPKAIRGFTADERAAMEEVVNGTSSQNLARLLGRLSPQGNGLMAALQLGAAASSGGATIPAALVGMSAKTIADKATPRNVEKLSEIIRAGGSKKATVAAPNALQRLAKSKRDAIARAIMAGAVVNGRPVTQ